MANTQTIQETFEYANVEKTLVNVTITEDYYSNEMLTRTVITKDFNIETSQYLAAKQSEREAEQKNVALATADLAKTDKILIDLNESQPIPEPDPIPEDEPV